MSATTTTAKTIDRAVKRYLPEKYDPVDIYYRPYDSPNGDKGWVFVVEDMEAGKSASMNLGMNPTKLIARKGILGVVDRLEKEGHPETAPKIQKPTPGQVRKVLASHD